MKTQPTTLRLLLGLVLLVSPAHWAVGGEPEGSPPPRQFFAKWKDAHGRSMTRDIAPPGTSLYGIFAAQAAAGQAANMMLYQYDFVPGSDRLSPRGHYQATKLAQRLQYLPYPLLIERTGSSALDESRRAHVLATLGDAGLALDADRVLSSRPTTRGLDGLDAILIHSGLLDLSASGMISPAGGVMAPGGGQPPPAQ